MANDKLFILGIFLAILGIGNIMVGSFKESQYIQVIQDLSSLKPTELFSMGESENSHLAGKAFQFSDKSTVRITQRQTEAQMRLEFYNFVSYGGKVFLGFGLVLLIVLGIKNLLQQKILHLVK